MATKCITITTEAYDRLASEKKENESFSEVIKRITGARSLKDLIGIFSESEAKELEENIMKNRERMRNEMREVF